MRGKINNKFATRFQFGVLLILVLKSEEIEMLKLFYYVDRRILLGSLVHMTKSCALVQCMLLCFFLVVSVAIQFFINVLILRKKNQKIVKKKNNENPQKIHFDIFVSLLTFLTSS